MACGDRAAARAARATPREFRIAFPGGRRYRRAMQLLAVGFWGAFFGTVALMLAGGLLAFAQSHHRVALAAGMTGLLSGMYVASFLHLLPIADPLLEARVM